MRLITEFEHQIIWVACITHSISASQQHLEWNVGDSFTQLSQTLPWTLVQETQSYIKCRTLKNGEVGCQAFFSHAQDRK